MGRIPLMAFELNNISIKIKDLLNKSCEKIFVKVDLIPYTEIELQDTKEVRIKSGDFKLSCNHHYMLFNNVKFVNQHRYINSIEHLKNIPIEIEGCKSKIVLADIYSILNKYKDKVYIIPKYNIFVSKAWYIFNIVTDDEADINNRFVFLYTVEDTSGNIIYSSEYKEVKNNELNLCQ